MKTIEVRYYGNENTPSNSKTEATLYIPHSACSEEFKKNFPELYQEIIDASPEDEQTLKMLWKMEQDLFTDTFAELVAEKAMKLCMTVRNSRIRIIRVLLPRAIADVNRIPEIAIWNIFDFEKHSQLYQQLLKIHEETLTHIQALLEGSPICREIHSMSPLYPSTDQEVTLSTIKDRIQAWSGYDGERIKSDVVCIRNGEEIISVGDEESIRKLVQAYEEHGISLGLSERYQVDDRHYSPHWDEFVGSHLVFDFTKENGSMQQPGEESFHLAKLKLDRERLESFAIPFAKALAEDMKRLFVEEQNVSRKEAV